MTTSQEKLQKAAEEIVGRIGNIANRPDLRECQEGQVRDIVQLAKDCSDETIRLVLEELRSGATKDLQSDGGNFYCSSATIANYLEKRFSEKEGG